MKYYNLLAICIGMLLFVSCGEDPIGQTAVDGVAPGTVTDVKIDDIPGGAVLTYTLPEDEDLLYVKALYSLKGSVISEEKASVYTDTLRIEGFGDTLARKVDLICVDRSGNESEPFNVTIHPLKPPVSRIFESVRLVEGIGGVKFFWENPTEANISIVLAQRIEGEFKVIETVYSKRKEGMQAIRGLDTIATDFSLFIRDRWDNYSDTLMESLKPLFEMKMEGIKQYRMALDAPEYGAWNFSKLFDGKLGESESGLESNYGGWPQCFTFKFKEPVNLSRFKMYQRITYSYAYAHGNVRKFEMWGSNAPNKDGSYDGWTLIGAFSSVKPSGLPLGQVTNEDIDYARKGEEYEVPSGLPAFEYMRLNVTETWARNKWFDLMEMEFWGAPSLK